MLYNIPRIQKGGIIMKFSKMESKNVLGLFDIKKKDISENEKIVSFASEYWADAIMNAGKGQINYQMGNGMIELSENDIEAFKEAFNNYILKIFPTNGNKIMLWTSDGEYFERVGTDAYLKQIMSDCNLPLTCLPSDVSMNIYNKRIELEDGYQFDVIYSLEEKKVK